MFEKISNDLKTFMKSKQKLEVSVLRMLIADLKNEMINLQLVSIDDGTFFKVLRRNITKREEALDIYTKANREDFVDKEKKEIDILKKYLPVQLSDLDLESLVKEEISNLKNFSQKDIGLIIKNLSSRFPNQVDGRRISEVIKRSINS